jgi:hypothetical protein
MSRTSQRVGLLLIAVGFVAYFATGMTSPTALIPAFFGLAISLLGFYGRHERHGRTALTLALGVALVGLIGSLRGLIALPTLLVSGDVTRPAAVIAQSLMAVILIVYLVTGLADLRRR